MPSKTTKKNLITVIFPSVESMEANINEVPNESLILVKSDINDFLGTNLSSLIDDSKVAADKAYSSSKIATLLKEQNTIITNLKNAYKELETSYNELKKKLIPEDTTTLNNQV